MYSSGPFLGRMVDNRGPRPILVSAFVLLLVGYMGIRALFNLGPSASGSTSTFWMLIICAFMTGVGGNGSMISAMNATAKSFPDRAVRRNPVVTLHLMIYSSESDSDRYRAVRLWPVCILLLHYLAHVSRRHIGVSSSPRPRNIFSYGHRFLPRTPDSVTGIRDPKQHRIRCSPSRTLG